MKKTAFFIFFFMIFFIEGSCENVGIKNITWNVDSEGKFFDIFLDNYDKNTAEGNISITFNCDKFNDTLFKEFKISPYELKEFRYYYDFCRCNVSVILKVKNNKNKHVNLTKEIFPEINFDELSLKVSGKIFPYVNAKFKIFDNKKEIYEGDIVNGKFHFELKKPGRFLMVVEYNSCNISKEFETKYKTIITLMNVKGENVDALTEGDEGKIFVSDENGNAIKGVSVFCDKILCGRTDENGIFKFYANKTFKIFIPETFLTWSKEKEIIVKEKEKIEILTKNFNAYKEDFSVFEPVEIIVKLKNETLENVSVKIVNEEKNITIIETINRSKTFYFDKEGVYEISAEKENFKSEKKKIFVKRNFYFNMSVDEENERVTITVIDAITKERISSAIVTIEYSNITRTQKTDIDGEILFKIPEEKYKICIEKENYNKICSDVESMKKIKIVLSKNYIFENHYKVFSNLNLTTFYAYKDVPLIVDEIFIKTEKKNFSIYPKYALTTIFLNETGKYEICAKRKGYIDECVNIFVEKKNVDVYLSISNGMLIINSTQNVDIAIECNNTKKIIIANNSIKASNISENECKIILPEQYNGKFYVNNKLTKEDCNIFKFRIRKIYDATWLYTAIIVIVLLSSLVIVRHRYKRE